MMFYLDIEIHQVRLPSESIAWLKICYGDHNLLVSLKRSEAWKKKEKNVLYATIQV